MGEYKLGEIESRFALLIWNNEPVHSRELVKLAEAELSWKKSTTYTILKRLCDRGLFKNEDGVVTSLVSKAELESMQSQKFVEDAFEGSLPKFLAAFSAGKKLTDEEIGELEKLIEEHRRWKQ